MSIDWNGTLRTKSGKFGLLLPKDPLDRRQRVAIARNGQKPATDPSEWSKPGAEVTVWLYADNGTIRCDGEPSDMDLAA